ncbi:diguanylate cyclase [Thermoclostridium stercorarium subsp. stercorarium DSM 8532]|uniref:sensor domain-containing diguanylate cyclase n=1 Tax=Thermoclostridium stercorarium TaxID=1510 RepID=UPI0002C5AEBB|nr:sensor domain-containing diguanylate cyclase [Thermoclostridium stercorarium]AGI40139.1 diguanylate cyclase [Thermoclostridium stercorarium subsp. stercorarium DSM 8532]
MLKRKYRMISNLPVEFTRYEKVIRNFLWVAVPLLVLSDVYAGCVENAAASSYGKIVLQVALYAALITTSLLKLNYIKKNNPLSGKIYKILKYIDILLITLFVSTLRHGFSYCFITVVPVFSVCITDGFGTSMGYMMFALVTQILSLLFADFIHLNRIPELESFNILNTVFLVIYVLVFIALFRIFGIHSELYRLKEKDNQKLVAELKRKYVQLEQAKFEKQEQFEKLKEINYQLEDMNKKLASSLAEFFTLQQISQAIGSIFDMDELLKFVNDIIIGVMGVATSNIALYNKEGNRLKVQVTNISNPRERAILTDNINVPPLRECVDKGRTIIDNAVEPEKYPFTKGRNVKSLLCVPLQVKGKGYGLILIEHTIPNAFSEDNVRLLEVITQHISIAIENAKLYEQLQEYANTDSLTQVYNRSYFQKRLREEIARAKQQGYEVSIIFFDVDDFKVYNDTYGHLFGDMILKSIALTVKEAVRKDDVVARFGGEEFVVLLPHTDKETAYEKAEELRRKISEIVVCDKSDNSAISVSVSMGVSTFPTLALNEIDLLNSADEALYMAKAMGKNRVAMAKSSDTCPVSKV